MFIAYRLYLCVSSLTQLRCLEQKESSHDCQVTTFFDQEVLLSKAPAVEVLLCALHAQKVVARALATYLIPGCVGRGVRLGSESLSGAARAGAWKSGNMEIWEFGDLGIWRAGDLEIQKFGDLGTWKSRNLRSQNKKKSQISNLFCLKMSARSGLIGKNPPRPIWGHLRPFFPWTGKIQKLSKNCLFSRFGPLLLSTQGGRIGISSKHLGQVPALSLVPWRGCWKHLLCHLHRVCRSNVQATRFLRDFGIGASDVHRTLQLCNQGK